MEQNRLQYLFEQYIAKTYTTAELEEFMSFLKRSDGSEAMELILEKYWDEASEVEMEEIKADAILKNALDADSHFKKTTPIVSLKWLGWVAAALVVGFAIFMATQNNVDQKSDTLVVRPSQETPVTEAEMIVVKTTDEHQKIILPDGSSVILNDHSSISYPKTFTKNREVYLKGEGYFDIKHNETAPFVVFTGSLSTTVLGTAFNIKAYDNDNNIHVTVTRGKVGVVDSNKHVIYVMPNQQVIFNKYQRKSNLETVVVKNVIQWQESDIFFDDVSMEQAVQELSKRFNNTISFANEQAKKCRFTATFLKGESLEEILKVICSFNNVHYQTTAGGITIEGEGCE